MVVAAALQGTDVELGALGKTARIEARGEDLRRAANRTDIGSVVLLYQKEHIGGLRKSAGKEAVVVVEHQVRRPHVHRAGMRCLEDGDSHYRRTTQREGIFGKQIDAVHALIANAYGEESIRIRNR